MKATVIAKTEFLPYVAASVMQGFSTDVQGGEALCESAGRACYQSFKKPNPKTSKNADYLKHILEVGHESVLEHASVTFYIEGISRSCTHELIRHRHFSYSQQSQRYVDESVANIVAPPSIASDPLLMKEFVEVTGNAKDSYTSLVRELEARFSHIENRTSRRKLAREAARSVLPNAVETRIVVTGNYRAWRHFVALRATEHADVEIRAVAIECLRQLQGVAPTVFGDFEVVDGVLKS